MASNNGATVPEDPTQGAQEATDLKGKGKGKAVATEEPVDHSMDEDDDEESGDEEVGDAEEEDDGLEEIDLNNIVDGGRRTRGRVIDWAKAAQENPPEDGDDDDDDEEDFEPEAEGNGDKMDED